MEDPLCVAITSKGKRCLNKKKFHDLCGIHKNQRDKSRPRTPIIPADPDSPPKPDEIDFTKNDVCSSCGTENSVLDQYVGCSVCDNNLCLSCIVNDITYCRSCQYKKLMKNYTKPNFKIVKVPNPSDKSNTNYLEETWYLCEHCQNYNSNTRFCNYCKNYSCIDCHSRNYGTRSYTEDLHNNHNLNCKHCSTRFYFSKPCDIKNCNEYVCTNCGILGNGFAVCNNHSKKCHCCRKMVSSDLAPSIFRGYVIIGDIVCCFDHFLLMKEISKNFNLPKDIIKYILRCF